MSKKDAKVKIIGQTGNMFDQYFFFRVADKEAPSLSFLVFFPMIITTNISINTSYST